MAKRRPDDDEGFEVVEDEPPRKKKRRPIDDDEDTRPTRSAKTRFNDDDEEPPRKKKRRPVEVEDDEEVRPKSRSRRDEDDGDIDDRPRKKKPRLSKKDRERLRQEEIDARDAAKENAIMEWGPPIFLTFLGAVMMIVAGVIWANRTGGLVNPPLLLGIAFAFTVVLVPVIIVALMVIGGVMGIEYGTLKNAVRSLLAISMMSWGIFFVSNLFFIGWVFGPLLSFIVTFGLFMVFFNLDVQEAMSTLGALNLIMWLADKLFWVVIIVMLTRGGNRDRGRDPGFDPDDDNPRAVEKGGQFGNRGNRPNRFDPDDFDDDN